MWSAHLSSPHAQLISPHALSLTSVLSHVAQSLFMMWWAGAQARHQHVMTCQAHQPLICI